MIVSDLYAELALHVHDVAYAEITAAQWVTFIASASRDARNKGWYVRLDDDESLTIADNDFDYDVPGSFARIGAIYQGESIDGATVYLRRVPDAHWVIRYDGASPVPVLHFHTLSSLESGAALKITGQRRPTIYTTGGQTIDAGMESFLRERAKYYALQFLAAGRSEYATWRQQMALLALQESEKFFKAHPAEFRAEPGSILVKGRE